MNNGFMTTNGMKVRLDPEYCYEYLNEEDDVISWFISIEAFSSFGGLLSLIGTIFLMFSDINPINAGFIVIMLYIFGFIVSQSYTLMRLFNLVYGLIFMVYEKLMRLFIPYIALIIVMFITKQYMIFISYLVARIIVFFLVMSIYSIRGKALRSKYGLFLGDIEMTAIKSLKLYSKQHISFKNWVQDYSKFQNKNSEIISNSK